MWKDPIVEEVRRLRLQFEAECDNDIEKICAKILEAQKARSQKLMTQPFPTEKTSERHRYEQTTTELAVVRDEQPEKYAPLVTSAAEKTIISSKAPEPVGLYPHARRIGNLLFLSGIGPRERASNKIPGVKLDEKGNIISYDIEAQCHSVFANVRYILEDAGSRWENIIDVTVFLTNIKDDFPTFNRVYAEYFKNNQPCRTTVEVNRLPTPIAIELKVIATID